MPTNLVDIHHRRAHLARNGTNECLALPVLTFVEGRGVDRHQKIKVVVCQFGDKVGAITPRKLRIIAPDVFAHQHGDTFVFVREKRKLGHGVRVKVALLVKDIIGRQEGFLLHRYDTIPVNRHCRVVNPGAKMWVPHRRTKDKRHLTYVLTELVKRLLMFSVELLIQKKIFRRIPPQCKLGRYHKLCALRYRFLVEA